MRLEVSCEDRLGLTRELLDRLVEHNIDLRGIEIDTSGIIYLNFPELEFRDFQHLMPEIRRIPGVYDVKTIPYMPSEREHHEIEALLKALPDLVFSLDAKGKVTQANQSALTTLALPMEEVRGAALGSLVKGFSFSRWLEASEIRPQTCKLSINGEEYLADLMPLFVAEEKGRQALAGAVVVLKSARRVGMHFSALHAVEVGGFEHLQAESQKMKQVLAQASKLAMQDAPLLIVGETGTGKELLARACHGASLRSSHPFMALNCAAMPDNVAESELFGYAPGAFGNNTEGKRGVLELASGGTLMLDEIGDMSPHLQTKFLRVLQDGVFRRVGDEQEVKVNVRFICTTQKQLLDLVHEGKFREDLYYRLNVLSLALPPLRERKADIMALAQQFVSRFASELQRPRPRFTRNMAEYLTAYRWPGNVRQLRNCLYRAMTLLEGDEIGPEHVDLPVAADAMPLIDEWFEGGLDEAVKRFESRLLERLYPAFPSTRQLAKRLGVSHTAIANKLREYGINKK
ncbi:TPA: transcriptional regulator TyrR [Aeromonas hydrophila]|uniref:HTH-type transcriptional regulatory protein TyrR n=1 Tax=Aeromonas hydrophila subsp. hydrophila (strain ATCC 7966 / DSM 30187 / BCRC 13018 / CCUG 14551 / JCM 1027 / KCTC 2358 / NCIMB 9240 / NCTC 8049) TaxID=380703 RepID=A0KJG6_AERHH|nr:transcriptional regulator TyrR [Aeromonas hydrophila]ABK36633.1 transcriptional regulatory protein TyrR [Aeromonas hydrophila subsp. hydrophila ATCC 7966]AJQ54417.1 transcriptional regulator [Aeromonas hydrophila]MBQ4676604.1 transcriptional regulator TyrR [Aeromonas hydrophila]MBS4671094.1 transcriptional regulator TyrR [Aeromonas hydrophila]MBW3813209.1 transcriptional regulator TyrR [Aeromonas hydrophila]